MDFSPLKNRIGFLSRMAIPSTNKPGRRKSGGFLNAQQAGLQQRVSAAVNRRNQLNEGRKPARRQRQRRCHHKTRDNHHRRHRVMRLRRHRNFRRTARHSPGHRSTRRLAIPGFPRNSGTRMMRTIFHPRHRRSVTLRRLTPRLHQLVSPRMRDRRQCTPHHTSQHANPRRHPRSHDRPPRCKR
jgi:site-specific DNA-cytosine methylase